jgi:CrcB protein
VTGRAGEATVVAAVALGGAVGALARYAAGRGWPAASDAFPWATLIVNAVGCAAIGVLMVLISDVWVAHRLVRPFLGTGVLGGFTTFSAYALDVQHLLETGRQVAATAYLAGTVVAALVMVWVAAAVTRRALLPETRRSG